MDYIRSKDDFPLAGDIVLYGAGGRGQFVYEEIAREHPRLTVVGFLDSCKNGVFLDLPMLSLDSYLEKKSSDRIRQATIIVSSYAHMVITKSLKANGITNFYVYLDALESIFYYNLSAHEVVKHLRNHPHPLVVANIQRGTGEGIHYACSKFSSIHFRPKGLSPCCWPPDIVNVCDPREALDRCMAINKEFIAQTDAGYNTFCLCCPQLRRTDKPYEFTKFTNFDIDSSITCNLDCCYCQVKNFEPCVKYDTNEVVTYALDNGYVAERCSFSWGGFGEPTINPNFDVITSRFLDLKYIGTIYTNAVKYSETIEAGLRDNLLTIWPSVDSGTRETYKKIRRVDAFNQVWSHLEKYIQTNANNVFIKYIVTPDNASPENIELFIRKCTDAGVKHLMLAKDFFEPNVADVVVDGLVLLARLAKRADIQYAYQQTAIPQQLIDTIEQRL